MKKLSIAIITIFILFITLINGTSLYYLNHQVTELEKINSEIAEEMIKVSQKNEKLKQEIEEAHSYDYSNLTLEQKFRIAANEYNIDFKLLYAIAYHETGNFTSPLWLNSHNPGGMKGGDGWMQFHSQFEGIMAMARTLYRGYISKGLDTLEEIQPIYCPDSDSWTPKVRAIINQLSE